MTELIIGNLCSLLAMVTDSVSSSRKTAKGVLFVQCISQAIYGAGAITLKGYSVAANLVVIVSTIVFLIKDKK